VATPEPHGAGARALVHRYGGDSAATLADEVQFRPGGNCRFNHSETILPVQMRLIPFFALGYQVFSMILSTFFYAGWFR
jgi:hypothetical protein